MLSESLLIMYFTVNLAFVNYFDNLTKSSEFPILLGTMYKQMLSISVDTFDFKPELLKEPKKIKDPLTKLHINKKLFI